MCLCDAKKVLNHHFIDQDKKKKTNFLHQLINQML